MKVPTISIGIPTYNRAATLRLAIESVLSQSYGDLEVVISDNASNDGTEAVCRDLARGDARIRYERSPVNRGPTSNFNAVLQRAAGEHFMWLSDDDWLDRDYVAACLALLQDDPSVAVAAGRCKLYGPGGTFLRIDDSTNLRQVDPRARVLAYYSTVGLNSAFYGVMRTARIRQIGMRNMLANDWLAMAWMAWHGAIVTLENAFLHRVLGGTSRSFERIIEICGLPGYQRHMPQVICAFNISVPLLSRRTWPEPMPFVRRLSLALNAFLIQLLRHTWFRRFVPRRYRHAFVRSFSAG